MISKNEYMDAKKFPLTTITDFDEEDTLDDNYETQLMKDSLDWSMLIDGYLNGEKITPEIQNKISELEVKLEEDFTSAVSK